MPETITHVSFSRAGGAGSVARILSEEQRRQGRNSRLISVIGSDLRAAPLSSPLHTIAAGLDEYLIKKRNFPSPISALRDLVSGIRIKDLSSSDVIHLHGINGALGLEELQAVPKDTRVIWTLHDMNPFTGTCHYSLGCDGFKVACSACPAVKSVFSRAVSDLLTRKKDAVAKISNLTVVSPSQWLADEARQSVVFRSHPITVIPNPIDPIFLDEKRPGTIGDNPGLLRVIVVAKNLSDPVKQVGFAVRAFRSAFPRAGDATLTLVGSGGTEFESGDVALTGPLSKPDLARIFASSDILIVPSKGENAPLVIGEAAANGCLPLVASVGGMGEMVSAIQHGAVFENFEELTHCLIKFGQVEASTRRRTREEIRARARRLYSPSAAVKEYDKVYST